MYILIYNFRAVEQKVLELFIEIANHSILFYVNGDCKFIIRNVSPVADGHLGCVVSIKNNTAGGQSALCHL